MRTRLRNYFLAKYIDESDVFEYARALMVYRFSMMFTIIFLLPLGADIAGGLKKATIMHGIDLLSLLTIPFLLRRLSKIDHLINYFFFVVFFSTLLATMMLNPMRVDVIAVAWVMFFLCLSALLQRGIARILFCGFFGWAPILYVIINIKTGGAITWEWFIQQGTDDPPMFLIFIPIVLGIYAIWTHTGTIQKAKETITEQKNIIQLRNKDITDSINYAKRIQQAKLPRIEDVRSSLPKSFILFKPKDIVSGDFYFFHKTESAIFIAAADCTGHGVPGALMSMIGSEKLEDAVSQSKDPAEILHLLNKGIKTSLRQSLGEESTRDGMDIAFCAVYPQNGIVKYAGANRPLWIARKGQTTIEEIKATKKGIGGFTEESQYFDAHEIKLLPGDVFYITTDGYADTFGGPESKKLTTKKLKQLLLDICNLDMKEQEKHLNNYIENWKGSTEQIDDILVIGVKI